MKIAILAITDKGKQAARMIQAQFPESVIIQGNQGVRKKIEFVWNDYDALICIMATGIVVRCIAHLCKSKFEDPAVVVIDDHGQFAISLLSGHIGGANEIVKRLEKRCNITPVITTSSDLAGQSAVDLWAIEMGLIIDNPEVLAATTMKLLKDGTLTVFQDLEYVHDLPADFKMESDPSKADIVISYKNQITQDCLHLVPPILHIGLGCKRGVSVEQFQETLDDIAHRFNINLSAIAGAASIDLKKDEAGLVEIAKRYNWPLRFFTKEQINNLHIGEKNTHIFNKVGVHGVCEPAAILAASRGTKPGRLIIGKIKWEKITAAIAQEEPFMLLEQDRVH